MASTSIPTHTLNDGTTLPVVGFGTYPLTGADGTAAVVSALEVGYRLLDTAVNYGNETEVGEAIRRSGRATRGDPGRQQAPRGDTTRTTTPSPACTARWSGSASTSSTSTSSTGPTRASAQYAEAWRALVDLREQGLVRSIGVSNFTEQHLDRIIGETGRDAGGQPDRAAPVLPAAPDARRARAARDPDRVVEPAGQAAGTLHRAPGRLPRPNGTA